MRIAIIEDEKLTAENLAETILKVEPYSKIVTTLYSVEEAISYFQKNEKPDLIFSDVQLGDGLSFEIFKTVSVSIPIIFCTAYDEYALNAFKAKGIDYILKPFTKKTIAGALDRYKELKNNFSKNIPGYEKISELFENRNKQQNTSILIYIKDKIVPIKINEIALFYIEDETTRFFAFNQKVHIINKTLDELEKITGNNFYRANRKFLISRKAIKDVSQYFHRKLLINLSIPFKPEKPLTISKEKVTDFLNWLSEN